MSNSRIEVLLYLQLLPQLQSLYLRSVSIPSNLELFLFSLLSGENMEMQRISPLIEPTAHPPFLRADLEYYEQSLGLPSPGTV